MRLVNVIHTLEICMFDGKLKQSCVERENSQTDQK
jgi:hypothetical protein